MSYYLFLDDVRNPEECATPLFKRKSYPQSRGGFYPINYVNKEWTIVRNYDEFCDTLETKGLPMMVSFDHDLADIHYAKDYKFEENYEPVDPTDEKTGFDCAQYLINYCVKHHEQLPKYAIHSMNPAGSENIKRLLENFKNHGSHS